MRSRAKVFEYAARLDADGGISAEGSPPVGLSDEWAAEHLVLAALAKCTLTSLGFYARGAAVSGSADLHGTVTRRDEDGRFALVEVAADFDVAIDPEPAPEELPRLLAQAEWGCFVGNSLRVTPRSTWQVNGRPVTPAAE